LWHWGDNGVFKAFVIAEPKSKSGVVMFENSENGLDIEKPIVEETTGFAFLAFGWIK